jgi:hypothetical protein
MDKRVGLSSIDDGALVYETVDEYKTQLLDKYGNSIRLTNFKPGDIVEVETGGADTPLTSLSLSVNAWSFESPAAVDTGRKTITISNVAYNYDDNVIVVYEGKPYDLSNIDPIDTLLVKGRKDKALYVSVQTSHGTIVCPARPDIKNGSIGIDNRTLRPLSSAFEINVSEGSHRIVVTGDNIKEYEDKSVIVSTGDYLTLDLDGLVFLICKLDFQSIPEGAVVEIDGRVIDDVSGTLEMKYGDYQIRVTADGYETWERTVALESSRKTVTPDLAPLVKVGSLQITSSPPDANVWIDNVYAGQSPLTVSVEYGERYIYLRKEGYRDASATVVISGGYIPLPITMEPSESGEPAADLPGAGDPETVPETPEEWSE